MTIYYSPKELAYAELQRMEQLAADILNTPVSVSYTAESQSAESAQAKANRIWKITEEMARGS